MGLQAGRRTCDLSRAEDILRVLGLFDSHSLNAGEVEMWAEAVGGRDVLAYSSSAVADVLFDLATPELQGRLTGSRVRELIVALEEGGSAEVEA